MLKFDDFFNYLRNEIILTSDSLYDNNQISKKYDFIFYKEMGDYIEEIKTNCYNIDDDVDAKILIRLSDSGRVQDPSTAIESYIQTIGFQIISSEEQFKDMQTLVSIIFQNFRVKKDSINNNATFFNVISTSEWNKVKLGADDCMTTVLAFMATVYEGTLLSDLYTLKIDSDSLVIPTDAISMSNSTNIVQDLKKSDNVKYFANSAVFTLSIGGLFIKDHSVLKTLLNDCSNNAKFGQLYKVDLLDENGESISGFPKNMICSESKFDFIRGSVLKYSATFYEGVIL